MRTYLVVYFGSALVAMLLVPLVFRLARRYSLFDNPGPRKLHSVPVPRVGGISFAAGSLALILPVFFLDNAIADSFNSARPQFLALLAGAVLVYMVGLIDDLRPVRGSLKLLFLVAASLFFCLSGAAIHTIRLGSWLTIHTGWAAVPLTVCWIAGITVCIGVIDGLDGLAAGIAAMVCGTLAIFALWSGQSAMAVLMLALLGGITGFLIFNFYPAKIFMGDGGSLFLGFMIGGSSVLCQTKTSTFVALALPFLVLGMPILDTGLVFAFRGFIKRRSLFAADNNHLHHRLLRHGLKHRSVVIVMYAITAISASIGIFMLRANGNLSVVLLMSGIIFLFFVLALLQKGRYERLFRGLRRNLAVAQRIRCQTRSFEVAQDKMRESRTFESWWQILCSMGQSMRFKSLILLHDNNGRNFNSQWNSTEKYENRGRTIELKIPLGLSDKSGFILRACIYVDDYLELSGHQVKLLTRLMDEFPMPHSHALTGGEHAQVQGTCGEPAAQETVSSHPKEETELTAAERDEDSDFAGSPASDGTLAGHEFLSDSLKIISLGLKHIFRQHK